MVKVSQEWRVPITYKYLSIYEGKTCSWAFIKSLTLFMNGDLCLEREFLWEVKVFRVFGLWGWKTFYVSKSHNIPKIANYNFPFIQMSMDGIYQTTYGLAVSCTSLQTSMDNSDWQSTNPWADHRGTPSICRERSQMETFIHNCIFGLTTSIDESIDLDVNSRDIVAIFFIDFGSITWVLFKDH